MRPFEPPTDANSTESGQADIIEIESGVEDNQQMLSHQDGVPDTLEVPRTSESDPSLRNENVETLCNTDDDDDELQVVGESILSERQTSYPETEYVDLDRSGEGSLGQRRPQAASSEEDLVILEERTSSPSFVLNLPGGEYLRINGSPLDQPVRRSFQAQAPRQFDSAGARRRLARRTARTASNLFMQPSDDEQEESVEGNTYQLPSTVMARRQRNALLMQRRPQPSRRQPVRGFGMIQSPELSALEAQINRLPPNVRSAFDHAQSVHEFRSILQSIDWQNYHQRQDDLTSLFSEYRANLLRSRSNQRIRRPGERSRLDSRMAGQDPSAHNLPYSPSLVGIMAQTFNPVLGRMHMGYDARTHGGIMGYGEVDEEQQTQNIIQMIQEREEQEYEARKRKYMEDTKSKQLGYLEKAVKLPEGYSSSFDTTPKMNITIKKNGKEEELTVTDDQAAAFYMDLPSCSLCGVELGVGIPDEFQGLSTQDRGVSFEALKAKYEFHCPYQALSKPSLVDRDLSRRTYVAACGHSFCGRCFARIDNARSFNRASKQKLKDLKGASHPDNYGPKKCPAKDCNNQLRNRGKMREVYF